MKKYKSKIGTGITSLLVIIIGGISTMMIINQIWFGLAINMAVAGFTIYLFASFRYLINDSELIIKSGFVKKIIIKIENIKKIEETNNPLSSPAASLDRLAIYYDKSGFVLISPREKMEFIKNLTDINTKIVVTLKKDKRKN